MVNINQKQTKTKQQQTPVIFKNILKVSENFIKFKQGNKGICETHK